MAFTVSHRELGFPPAGGYPKERIATFDVVIGPVSNDISRMAGAEESHFALGAIIPRLKFANGHVRGVRRTPIQDRKEELSGAFADFWRDLFARLWREAQPKSTAQSVSQPVVQSVSHPVVQPVSSQIVSKPVAANIENKKCSWVCK